MDCCLCGNLIPLVGSLLILLTVALCERPPNTPLGRALYLSIAIHALAVAYLLFCMWFPPWELRGPYPYSTFLESMWNNHIEQLMALLGLVYLAFGMTIRAIVGRSYRDEDVDE